MSAIIDAIAKRNAALVPGAPVRRWAKLANGGLAMSDPMGGMVMESVNTQACCAQFVVSTADIDRSGDIVLPRGCLEYLSEYEKNPIVCIDHREKFPLPPAQALDAAGNFGLAVEETRITSWAKFHLLTEESRDFCALTMEKVLRGASVCFLPLMAHPNIQQKAKEDERDTEGHVYSKWRFLEWSICVLQDNQNALQMCLSKGRVGDHKLESEAVKKAMAATLPEPRRDARRPSTPIKKNVSVSKSLAQHLPLAYDRGNSRESPAMLEPVGKGRPGLVLNPTSHRWERPGGDKPAAKPTRNAGGKATYDAATLDNKTPSKPVNVLPPEKPAWTKEGSEREHRERGEADRAASDATKPKEKPGILQRIGNYFSGKKAMKAIAYIEADTQAQIDKFVRKHLGGVVVLKAQGMSEGDGPDGGMVIEHDEPDSDDVVPGAKMMADHLAMCQAHKDMCAMHKDMLVEHAPKQENEEMKKFHNKAMDDLDAHEENANEMHEEAKSKAAELYPDHDFGEGNQPSEKTEVDEEGKPKEKKKDEPELDADGKPKGKKKDEAGKEYTDGKVEEEAGKKKPEEEEKKKGIVRRYAVKRKAVKVDSPEELAALEKQLRSLKNMVGVA